MTTASARRRRPRFVAALLLLVAAPMVVQAREPRAQARACSAWTLVATPNPAGAGANNFLFDVAARSRTDAWAVGEFASLGAVDETLALHWDGSRWAHVTTPNPLRLTLSHFTSVSIAPD